MTAQRNPPGRGSVDAPGPGSIPVSQIRAVCGLFGTVPVRDAGHRGTAPLGMRGQKGLQEPGAAPGGGGRASRVFVQVRSRALFPGDGVSREIRGRSGPEGRAGIKGTRGRGRRERGGSGQPGKGPSPGLLGDSRGCPCACPSASSQHLLNISYIIYVY